MPETHEKALQEQIKRPVCASRTERFRRGEYIYPHPDAIPLREHQKEANPMSHVNHNGNRPVEHIADPEHPILASAEPIDNHAVDPDFDRHKGPHIKGPHDPKEINPKMASDIAYWAAEFKVTGERLHEAIRVHGTHVDKVRAGLHAK